MENMDKERMRAVLAFLYFGDTPKIVETATDFVDSCLVVYDLIVYSGGERSWFVLEEEEVKILIAAGIIECVKEVDEWTVKIWNYGLTAEAKKRMVDFLLKNSIPALTEAQNAS